MIWLDADRSVDEIIDSIKADGVRYGLQAFEVDMKRPPARLVILISVLPLLSAQMTFRATLANPPEGDGQLSTTAPATAPSAVGDATLLDQFKSQYPAARAKLEESYSHVRIVGTLTKLDQEGKLFDESDVEYLRNGLLTRHTSITTKTTRAIWPVGSVVLVGGSEDKFFLLSKAAGAKSFEYRSLGPYPGLKKGLSYAPPYSRPFATREYALGEFFKQTDVTVISAQPSPDDGPSAVMIVAQVAYPTYTQNAEFVFDERTWVLLRWSYQAGSNFTGSSNGSVTYRPNTNPPEMKSCDQWLTLPLRPNVKSGDEFWEIKAISFEQIPASKFTPEAAIADAPSGAGGNAATMP